MEDIEIVISIKTEDLSNECTQNPRTDIRCFCCNHCIGDFECDLFIEDKI